jgi:Xaa-Pro aminopeptidase
VANNHILQDGELVLIDAGCELHSYASDVTRTIPVNGRFDEAQASLYNAVLSANLHCIAMCVAGKTSLATVNAAAKSVLAQELVRLGFASSEGERAPAHCF